MRKPAKLQASCYVMLLSSAYLYLDSFNNRINKSISLNSFLINLFSELNGIWFDLLNELFFFK